jgi:hypothetical protein
MFRQFKEKNKNLLLLKLKSALKIEQISGFVNEIYFNKQGWTQKCAVQKANVDVNISYY